MMAESLRTVEQLCLERGIDARQLAERSGVDESLVLAIVLGRWTPSPQERDRIAAVFGLGREEVAWGHKTPIQHLYGQGPACTGRLLPSTGSAGEDDGGRTPRDRLGAPSPGRQ